MTEGVPLVAVAHGSRDSRSAATVHLLLDAVRRLRPDLDVRTAFLDLSTPYLSDVLAAAREDGYDEVVVVPLLLGNAFHARVDVPGVVADVEHRYPGFRAHIADVLGPDSRLERAAWRRLAEAGASVDDPALGVVLAGAGSAHQPANESVENTAGRWWSQSVWPAARAAFAAAVAPTVPQAIDELHAVGARRIAIGAWFLAPGLLPDRVIAQACAHTRAPLVAAPLADAPEVAELVAHRYTTALATREHGGERRLTPALRTC